MSSSIKVDFNSGKTRYRVQRVQGRNELIAKAIGWKKDVVLRVFDATAGLGKEAFLMAAMGCDVTLFERNPTVYALLQEGITEGLTDPFNASIIARMQLIQGCAIDYFNHAEFTPPDVIYCDPMFEPRIKSAAVKKEMQFLQQVVGQDQDAIQLIEHAFQIALKRLVVKRPHYAPPLKASPDLVFKARSHRFDVYLKHQK